MGGPVSGDDGWWLRCPYLVQQGRPSAPVAHRGMDVAPYTCKLGSGIAAAQTGGRAQPVACVQSCDANAACPHIANPLVRRAARFRAGLAGGAHRR